MKYDVIIIGAGNLGRALVHSHMFEHRGITRLAMFDVDPAIIGKSVSDLTVRSLDELEAFCREHKPKAAFLCVPSAAAPELSEKLIELGVTGFWNFSHYDIAIKHPEVSVENVHFGDTMMRLSYKIKKGQ